MSYQEKIELTNNSATSSLSVDAAVFVPTKCAQSDAPYSKDAAKVSKGHQSMVPRSLMEVPPYMTNCYPFVSHNSSPRPKQWTETRRFVQPCQLPFHGGAPRHRFTPPLQVHFNTQGSYSQGHQWMANTVVPTHPLVVTPAAIGFPVTFDGGTDDLGDGLLPTPSIPPLNMQGVVNPLTRVLVSEGPQYTTSLPITPQQMIRSGTKSNALNYQTSKGGIPCGRKGSSQGGRVSTGTQNENLGPLLRSGSRAIIMKDNSVQTDFSKEIADLTLSEKPNTFYRRGQKKNKGSHPHLSTDSEEVDSDSGYSSPLHRKNLVSNGTHPVRISALVEVDAEQDNDAMTLSSRICRRSSLSVEGGGMDAASARQLASNRPKDGSKAGNVPKEGLPQGHKISPKLLGSSGAKDSVWTGNGGKDVSRPLGEATKAGGRCLASIVDGQSWDSAKAAGIVENILQSPGKDSHRKEPYSPKPVPDFPALKPAKHNEPPWSLVPSCQKLRVSESVTVEGSNPPIKSYASIVKSLSTPSYSPHTHASVVSTSPATAIQANNCDLQQQNCDTPFARQSTSDEGQTTARILMLSEVHSVDSVLKNIANSRQQHNFPVPHHDQHPQLLQQQCQQQHLQSPSRQQGAQSEEDGKSETGGKKRRRRRRNRRQKTKGSEEGFSDGLSGMERTVSSSNISRTSDITLHFDEETDFPDIGLSNGAGNATFARVESSLSLSYSDVLKRKPAVSDVRNRTQSAPCSCLSGEEGGDENFSSQPGQVPESKKARKRKKRRELANRAADAELAEISLEQQMLRELGHKSTGRSVRPRSASREGKSPSRGLITDQNVVKQSKATKVKAHEPMTLSIADMLDAFEKKKALEQKTAPVNEGSKKVPAVKDDRHVKGNILDGSAPVLKRGKEREVPKHKKPSPLKKVILKEREEKKRMRLIEECGIYADLNSVTSEAEGGLEDDNSGNPVGLAESDLSQDGLSSRSVDTDQGVSPGADLSPISQTSPMSMSPLTPGASPISSPIAGYLGRDPVLLRIHSRRFREYCTQILDKDIDACCTSLLQELVRFQDRMYHKDPAKAKAKRRIVLGLREVTKHLKLKKIKCVIISPNLEKIQSKGGLDEALNNILNMCQEQSVPFVFALGRRALGRACAKLVPVSVAGIFNYDGCEAKFNQLISLTHKGREAYKEMVQAIELEIAQNPPPSMSASSSVPSLYAHMGHSRTPSGCSAISFTSSILSEPISENFPHAEPETDSKGYEIVVRSHMSNEITLNGHSAGSVDETAHSSSSRSMLQNCVGLTNFQPSVDDIDDGNEADTEDFADLPQQKKASSGSPVGKATDRRNSGGGDSATRAKDEKKTEDPQDVRDDSSLKKEENEEDACGSESESQFCDLAPIDSIHNSTYDLNTEILSQPSSRTLENSEVLSTHSSKTLGECSLAPSAAERARQEGSHTPESGHGASRVRLIDKDRIQTWLETTQLCLDGKDAQLIEEEEGNTEDKYKDVEGQNLEEEQART